MTAAAMTGPTPNSPVRLVPAAATAAASFLRVSRIRASTPRRSSMKSAASSRRATATASCGVIDLQQVRGVSCGDRLGNAARNQLAQHRVQPAGHLSAGTAQVLVAFGPHLQHRGVVIAPGLADIGRAQRRDRDRPGVVGIVLVRYPRSPATAPGRPSLGGTSSTRSPAASSCWASKWPTPPAPSTAQVRSGHAPRPRRATGSTWAAQARTRSWPSCSSAALMATAVCEALCGSTPIITTAMTGPSSRYPGVKTVAGTPNSRDLAGAHASFEPHHGEAPAGRHVVRKPSPAAASRRLREPASRDLSTVRPGSLPSRPGRTAYLKSQLGG